MKIIIKLSLMAVIGLIFAACSKVGDLPVYGKGSASTLTASSTAIAPAPADSNKVALMLNWTSPNYAVDSSRVKYTIEIDSTGKNFSKPYTKEVLGQSSTSFTAKELNDILLAKGYAFNVPVDMDVRLTTSYANNNERIVGNTIKIKMTPYKIPPKVALPTTSRLFIVGDATDFGWTNDPAPPFPAVRELTRLSETQWGGIFNMKGSGGYKLLQTQGVWSTQFHMVSGDAASGTFEQKDADPGFPSPAVAGAYKMIFDFQTGRYTVTKVDNAVPTELYITGDATASSWTNTPPVSQKFTAVTNGVFEITMALVPGKFYKFLSSNGNWQPQFGGSSATGGTIGANYGGGNDPDGIPTPTAAGN
ncbi:MAG TPA: SusE domain-containing protein, partial [Chitinophagaceae bacterium]|nr:SusE domain-containing protein [Chitinophagaceae bacterium]